MKCKQKNEKTMSTLVEKWADADYICVKFGLILILPERLFIYYKEVNVLPYLVFKDCFKSTHFWFRYYYSRRNQPSKNSVPFFIPTKTRNKYKNFTIATKNLTQALIKFLVWDKYVSSLHFWTLELTSQYYLCC